MNFGEFARRKREQAGLSQDEVARALGYEHRAAIHKLENGRYEWKLSSVIRPAQD